MIQDSEDSGKSGNRLPGNNFITLNKANSNNSNNDSDIVERTLESGETIQVHGYPPENEDGGKAAYRREWEAKQREKSKLRKEFGLDKPTKISRAQPSVLSEREVLVKKQKEEPEIQTQTGPPQDKVKVSAEIPEDPSDSDNDEDAQPEYVNSHLKLILTDVCSAEERVYSILKRTVT